MKEPIEAAATPIDPEFADLANEAIPDSEAPGVEDLNEPAGPPPIDPREVQFLATLLSAAGKVFAPRWLRIIQEGDSEARANGVDTPGGIVMISEAAIPVMNKYFPDLQNSPVINLLLVSAVVLGPCIGQPLRDPPPKKEEAKA